MKCQIGEAIEKIDKLISSSSKVDNNIKKQLAEVKIRLNSARDIKMAKMQSNTSGSESIDSTKKDFRSEFKNKRPSAAKWVDKEVAKFDVATQAISDGTNKSFTVL